MYMADGPRQRCPEGRTAQPGAHLTSATRATARGRRAPCTRLLHLPAPGLSLSRAGAAAQTSGSGRRCESIVHGQVVAQPGRQASRVRRLDWADLKRDCQPGGVDRTPSRGRTWLAGRIGPRTLRLEYQFDRLLPAKLARAYELLVPDQVRPALGSGGDQFAGRQEVLNHESSGAVRSCVVGSPERESHDFQPGGGTDRIRRQPWIPGSTRVALPG